MPQLILKTLFTLVMIAIAVGYIYIMQYRRQLRNFRWEIRQGDWVLLRVGSQLVRVLIVRLGSPGIMIVKQPGRNKKHLFVQVKNLYPIPEQ